MNNDISGGDGTQNRRHLRFPLRGAVDFRWSDNSGKCHRGEGMSRDISERGIFVETPACPHLGARTKTEVWIQHVKDAAQTYQVALEGRVVRVEEPGGDTYCGGFAMVAFESHFARLTSN